MTTNRTTDSPEETVSIHAEGTAINEVLTVLHETLIALPEHEKAKFTVQPSAGFADLDSTLLIIGSNILPWLIPLLIELIKKLKPRPQTGRIVIKGATFTVEIHPS